MTYNEKEAYGKGRAPWDFYGHHLSLLPYQLSSQ